MNAVKSVIVAALLAFGVSACSSTVEPAVVPPKVIPRLVARATAKAIPLRQTFAQVRAKIGPPQTIQKGIGLARKTRHGKAFEVPYVLWIYGVKGGSPTDSVSFNFQHGKLASVLINTSTTPKPNAGVTP